MGRRSLLGPALEERKPKLAPKAEPAEAPAVTGSGSIIKPSRRAKLHIGGYYEPSDPTIISFQELGIEIARPAQSTVVLQLQSPPGAEPPVPAKVARA